MFNSYYNNQTFKINAVSGTILKNYKESFFCSFSLGDNIAGMLLGSAPYLYVNRDRIPAVVIQMMLCGDKRVIAEVMWKKDYDRYFKQEEQK